MFHDDYLLLASSYQLAKPPKLLKKKKKKGFVLEAIFVLIKCVIWIIYEIYIHNIKRF